MTVGLGAWGIKVRSEQEGENVLTWVRSKLYRVVVQQMKTGGFNNPFIELENLGAARAWTDEDLYKHFGLFQEEIDYIENNTK
jgi:site-specific DNA-methyltransferase (adenine-specific)